MRFDHKRIIVTGGASGIGLAAAQAFAREGASVAVFDVQAPPPEDSLSYIPCDVRSEESVHNAIGQARAESDGRIDILFNNAGVAVRHSVTEQSVEEWERCFDVNARGVFLCAHFALPYMQRGSAVVNSASVTGVMGFRNRAAYSATKGAVVALTRNMALDYAPLGIRVNCICPGFVRTPLISAILADEARLAKLTALHPLGRLGEPADVVNAVLFLASEEASWITGQCLGVDGGLAAGHAADI